MTLLREIGTGLALTLMTEQERKTAKYHCGAPCDQPNAYPINSEADARDAWGLAGHSCNPPHVRACVRRVSKKEGWSLPKTAQAPSGSKSGTGFDTEKCAQRNRIAARRDGVDAVPLRLFRQDNPPETPESSLRYAHGTLPATMAEALSRINAGLPEGAPPLTADDVYIHYLEAANNNLVADRCMFLGDSTLRNIATDGAAGVSFLNSHADGSLSHPAELPMGKTFAGRYEQWHDGTRLARLAFYMPRGVRPNGAQGPSTDDLHRMIVSGTTTDVSVGLHDGERVCDVCGNDVGNRDLCTHSPGTHHNLTADQRTAQEARGVQKGRASYTLNEAHLHEVSAVYDGAVPGAGFRKTLALARRHELTRADLAEASQVYARLLRRGDLPMSEVEDEINDVVEGGVINALTRFFGPRRTPHRAASAPEEDSPFTTLLVPGEIAATAPSAEREALAREKADLDRQRQEFARDRYWQQAEGVVDTLIREGRALPAEDQPNADGKRALVAVFAQALADDASGTAIFGQAGGSRYAALSAAYAAREPHATLSAKERIPVTLLPTGDPPGDDPAVREHKLLALTPTGQAALKHKGAN